jgi:hypothetical protein
VRILLVGPVEDLVVSDIEAISLGDLVEVDRDLAVLVMLKFDEIDRLEDLAVGSGLEHLFGFWVDALVQLLAQVAHSKFPPVLDVKAKYQDEGRKLRRSTTPERYSRA